jgi:hypothetical protein
MPEVLYQSHGDVDELTIMRNDVLEMVPFLES